MRILQQQNSKFIYIPKSQASMSPCNILIKYLLRHVKDIAGRETNGDSQHHVILVQYSIYVKKNATKE